MSAAKAVLILAALPGRDDAEHAGEQIVEEGLAVSGSVIPGIHSFHQEEGRIRREHEALLMLWSDVASVEAIRHRLEEFHAGEADVVPLDDVRAGSGHWRWLGSLGSPLDRG